MDGQCQSNQFLGTIEDVVSDGNGRTNGMIKLIKSHHRSVELIGFLTKTSCRETDAEINFVTLPLYSTESKNVRIMFQYIFTCSLYLYMLNMSTVKLRLKQLVKRQRLEKRFPE